MTQWLKQQFTPVLGITAWIATVEEELPRLTRSVDSARLPSTPNAIERFSRTFQRFYTTRRGVHSVLSARREPVLFVVYLFAQRATTGQAPAVGLPRAVFIRLDGNRRYHFLTPCGGGHRWR